MAGAGAGERDKRSDMTAAQARRQHIAARAERAGLRLIAQPDPDAPPAGGQNGEEARLLGAYNLYNG